MRMRVFFNVAVACMTVATGSAAVAQDKAAAPSAQPKPPATAPAEATTPNAAAPVTAATGWVVNCSAPQANARILCEMSNAVVITSLNQRFVAVAVRPETEKGGYILVGTLPHGVVFTSGIIAKVDEKEVGELDPLTSDQQGAYARLTLTSDTISALEKGKNLTLVFDGLGGQKFTVAMSLSGFGAAFAKMKAEK